MRKSARVLGQEYALLAAAATYGIYKAAPHIKRWWNGTAIPSLKKMKNKVTGKFDKKQKFKPKFIYKPMFN